MNVRDRFLKERCLFAACGIHSKCFGLIKYIIKTRGSVDQLKLATIEEKHIFDNPLCRYLSGTGDIERLLTKDELDDCVEKAKANILYYFDFIFIDQYLNECCDYFTQYSGGLILNPTEKINTSRASEWYLGLNVFRCVCHEKYKRYYHHDYIIYEFIKILFLNKAAEFVGKLISDLNE